MFPAIRSITKVRPTANLLNNIFTRTFLNNATTTARTTNCNHVTNNTTNTLTAIEQCNIQIPPCIPTPSLLSWDTSRIPGVGLLNAVILGVRPLHTTCAVMRVYGMEYQPNTRRRKKKHGFLARLKSKTGRATLERRKAKGRKFLSH